MSKDTKGNHPAPSEDSLLRDSNSEITEERTKQIIDTYGEDEWLAVAQMSYQQVVDFYLAHRHQAKIRETKDTWEQKYNELFEMTKKYVARTHERGHTISEMREELATANHCWKECGERLDWLEDRMAPENAGKSFVIELCDDYRDRFFEIKEECIQSPSNGRSRPAKTARVKK